MSLWVLLILSYYYYIILIYFYRIYILTYIQQYIYTHGEQYVCLTYLRCLFYTHFFIYPSISVSGFDLTFRPLAVIHRLLFCKGIAGREHGKHRNAPYWQKTFHDPPKSKIAVS